jgi:hypothetical protein
VSPHVRGRRAGEGHNGLRIDPLEGGRYVAIPQNAVNNGYDVLPSRSVKFNTQRDNPFEAEGWITEDNTRAFMDSTIRGIFLPARHALFFYKGMGFFFDAAVVTEASRWAEEIMSVLGLDRFVEVHVGPPDAIIHGTQYKQERLDTIESLTAERRATHSSGRASRAADRERSAS